MDDQNTIEALTGDLASWKEYLSGHYDGFDEAMDHTITLIRAQAAQIADLTAERDRARARIAELENHVKLWQEQHDKELADGCALAADLATLRAQAEAMAEALERLHRNFRLFLAGRPVRDVAETEGEVINALSAYNAHKAATGPTE
jgi:chromosome segregation ATPase